MPSSSISCLLTVACQSCDVLEVQACGRQKRLLFGLCVVDGRETEGKGHGDPRREQIRKGWKMKNIM